MNAVKSNTATATTDTAETLAYVGRFAPSPTGDLHLGSLLTAVASFLDARANQGRWLLRMEDLDTEREVPGAASRILRCLELFQLHWDGPVSYQSRRAGLYEHALQELQAHDRTFRCTCSRQQLHNAAIYPGTCRRSAPSPDATAAVRFALEPGDMAFEDRIQGHIGADPSHSFGDFVIRRRDGTFAYMLAVVVDDAAQGVTHVVRGADLLSSTPAQIQIQRSLGYRQPVYAHVPVLTEPDGSKLAKSKRSLAVNPAATGRDLWSVLDLIGLQPPVDMRRATLPECWKWALAAWSIAKVAKRAELPALPRVS